MIVRHVLGRRSRAMGWKQTRQGGNSTSEPACHWRALGSSITDVTVRTCRDCSVLCINKSSELWLYGFMQRGVQGGSGTRT